MPRDKLISVRPAEPVRTCVGCRLRAERTDLLRVVVVAGELVPDGRRRLPGRGAYVHPETACLDLAERRRAFPRALRVAGPLSAVRLRAYVTGGTTATPAAPAQAPPGQAPGQARPGQAQEAGRDGDERSMSSRK